MMEEQNNVEQQSVNSNSRPFESRLDLSELHDGVNSIREALSGVLVGQQHQVELLLSALLANGHVLIEGVPGLAKTLMARALAAAVGVEFSRIQFTPDLMPTDVTGTSMFSPKTQEFQYHKGPVFSNFVLIDEINRAPAKTQAALFEVMEERTVTAAGNTYKMDEPFFVMATQNPIEHEGTYRLPEAQIDRFMYKLELSYPSLEDEVGILRAHHQKPAYSALQDMKPVVDGDFVRRSRALVQQVHVEAPLLTYIATLVGKTRNHKFISLGASPRASLALLNGAKSLAALQGRDFITPEDVQSVLIPALRHRMMLSAEAEMEGKRPDGMLKSLINSVEVPR